MPGSNPAGVTTSEEVCSVPFPRFAKVPQKLHIRSLLLPHPNRTRSAGLRFGNASYRTGVVGAHTALTREDEDRNLGAVPHGSMAKMVKAADCKSVIARSNRAGTSTMQDDVSRR